MGCRSTLAKRQLIRIVRTPTGTTVVDTTGKLAGRGAYLHQEPVCWQEGLKKGRLARALHTSLSPQDQEGLEAFYRAEVLGAGEPLAPAAPDANQPSA